jgi:hypothetical protein
MNHLMFVIQVLLERYLAPILLPCRRLFVGYAYRKIPLTQGKFALVDPEDYAGLARHKWCAAKQGNSYYAVRSEGGRQLRMHRVILNAPAGMVVDHIDHEGLNNTKRNLRSCTNTNGTRASNVTAAPAPSACSKTSATLPEPVTPPPSPSTANTPSSTSPPNPPSWPPSNAS